MTLWIRLRHFFEWAAATVAVGSLVAGFGTRTLPAPVLRASPGAPLASLFGLILSVAAASSFQMRLPEERCPTRGLGRISLISIAALMVIAAITQAVAFRVSNGHGNSLIAMRDAIGLVGITLACVHTRLRRHAAMPAALVWLASACLGRPRDGKVWAELVLWVNAPNGSRAAFLMAGLLAVAGTSLCLRRQLPT